MKTKVDNISNMRVTLRSKDNKDFIALNPKQSHTFESEEEFNRFEESVRLMTFSKFINKIEDVKEVKKPTEKVIDEDIINAIADLKKQINDLKVEFKATDDKEVKKEIKKEIKKLNDTIKSLS